MEGRRNRHETKDIKRKEMIKIGMLWLLLLLAAMPGFAQWKWFNPLQAEKNVVQDEDSNLKFSAGIVENNHTDKTKHTDATEQAEDSHRACISVTCESESGFRDTVYVPCRAVTVDDEKKPHEKQVKIRLLGTSSGCAADHVVPGSNVRRSFNGLAQAVFKVYNF